MSTTERVTLPSGNWIQMRDAKTLRRGDKKKAMSAVTDTERVMKMAYDMTDGLLAVLIIDWSYPAAAQHLPGVAGPAADRGRRRPDEGHRTGPGAGVPGLPGAQGPKQLKEQLANPASPTEPSAA
jgi:hypothetical protein